ncbi:MAG: methyltransferase [Ginsengibacter sp.]
MNSHYLILIILWIVYYAIHSVLAATSVKIFFKKTLDKYFRYYRLAYSVFALLALIALLRYQYSFPSPTLTNLIIVKYLAVLFLILPGLFIMLISLKKYFMLLSGIRSIFTPVSVPELKVNGIHKYMRHPLYSGTILFVFGLFFIFPTLSNFIAAILLTLYILTGISFEEKKLIKEFGNDYLEYKTQVRGLIPFLRKHESKKVNQSIFEG